MNHESFRLTVAVAEGIQLYEYVRAENNPIAPNGLKLAYLFERADWVQHQCVVSGVTGWDWIC